MADDRAPRYRALASHHRHRPLADPARSPRARPARERRHDPPDDRVLEPDRHARGLPAGPRRGARLEGPARAAPARVPPRGHRAALPVGAAPPPRDAAELARPEPDEAPRVERR